jgi:DNA-binding NtrC family response regulator
MVPMDWHSHTFPHPDGLGSPQAIGDTVPLAFDALASCHRGDGSAAPPIILVVDDHGHVGWLLHQILQELAPNHDIITSTDPFQAMECICGRTVSLLITDLTMPLMNGIDLAAQIKGRAPETQVLLITAYPEQLRPHEVQLLGIEYYLPKPFAFSDLERVVETALHC